MRRREGSLMRKLSVVSLLAIALALPVFVVPSKSSAQKLKSEDVVARHLESIVSAKERAAVKTRIISGTSQVVFRTTPVGHAVGPAVSSSVAIQSVLATSLPR